MKLEISILGSMEAWLYWRKYSYKDNKAIKGLVLFVLFCDTVQMAMLTESVYTYLVTNFANPNILAALSSMLIGEVMVSNCIAVVVQMFYCWRMWRLSKGNWFIVAPCVTLSVASFILLGYFAGTGMTYHTFLELAQLDTVSMTCNLLSTITDVAISVAMVGYLYSSKTGFRRSNDMINRLIVFTFNTGIPVSLSALLAFISINVWRGTFIYMFFFLMQGRLYTNSLLVTLNTREHIRDASSQPGATSRSGDFYTMGRFTEPAEGDPATPGPFTPGLSPRSAKHQSNPNSPIAIQIDTTRQNFVDGASEDNYPDKKGHESV
uniref:DUF6534 domain-containing protein n=1 Tax=Moniliophthora roreri TaxID=221103 RepID=A0A0W0G8K1_MONRR